MKPLKIWKIKFRAADSTQHEVRTSCVERRSLLSNAWVLVASLELFVA